MRSRRVVRVNIRTRASAVRNPPKPVVKKYPAIRGGRGLGDSLYVQAVARHFVKNKNRKLTVLSDHSEVFLPLGDQVEVLPHSRLGWDILAHYSRRRNIVATTQFEDCCIEALGQKTEEWRSVELKLDWEIQDPKFVESIRARCSKPILFVNDCHPPMQGNPQGKYLTPNWNVYQQIIDLARDKFTVVLVGAGGERVLHRLNNIDIDLVGKLSIAQLIDIAFIADGFIGASSYVIPLSESLNKNCLILWSSNQSNAPRGSFLWHTTPKKIFHGPKCKYIIDNQQDQIGKAVRRLCEI